MQGTMLIVSPRGSIKTCPLTRPPELEGVQREVGGWLEQVPHFKSIDYRGTVQTCVAFCNEEGKLNKLPVNDAATRMWAAALKRQGLDIRQVNDVLVGTIVVVFGDQELMNEL
jgi:hypothetical protein